MPDPWEAARSEAEAVIAGAGRRIEQLAFLTGDPETVADEHGRLPAERRGRFLGERRGRFLGEFAAILNGELAGLHERLPILRAELKTTKGREERAALRRELRQGTARLAYLQALPPFTAAGMCSECPWPMAWHDTAVTFCLETGAVLSEPCPAWPDWNTQRMIGFLRLHEMLSRRQQPQAPPAPTAPGPRRLEVITPGSSIEETIARLTAVQARHPGAQLRTGRRNSLEIWSAPLPGPPPGD